jgi:hypothetical protein
LLFTSLCIYASNNLKNQSFALEDTCSYYIATFLTFRQGRCSNEVSFCHHVLESLGITELSLSNIYSFNFSSRSISEKLTCLNFECMGVLRPATLICMIHSGMIPRGNKHALSWGVAQSINNDWRGQLVWLEFLVFISYTWTWTSREWSWPCL